MIGSGCSVLCTCANQNFHYIWIYCHLVTILVTTFYPSAPLGWRVLSLPGWAASGTLWTRQLFIDCLYHVVTLHGCSLHKNLAGVRHLCVTFLNFQTSSRSCCLVNTITLQELPVSFCNFTEIFYTSKSRTSSILTFWPFEIGHVQMAAPCSFLWIW